MIKLYWYGQEENIQNFGDELTPLLITRIFKKTYEKVEPQNCNLIGVGSLLEIFNSREYFSLNHKINVWGSGFIQRGFRHKNPNMRFHAVRGVLTQKRTNPNTVIGDPGLLANLCFDEGTKTGRIGVVVHYIEHNHDIVKKIKESPLFTVINPTDNVDLVIRQISACDFVLSSSLHGLIIADSFGIPNAWMPFSNKVGGNGYKFRDYFSGVNRKTTKANHKKIFNLDYLEKLRSEYTKIANLESIQNELIRAFPF